MSGSVLWMLGGCIQLLVLSSVRCSIDGIITAAEESFRAGTIKRNQGENRRYSSIASDNVWHDFYKIKGRSESFIKYQLDMIVTKEMYENHINIDTGDRSRKRRNALLGSSNLWPANTIPYALDNTFSEEEKKEITLAIAHWMAYTCIVFVPATSDHFNLIIFEAVDDVCDSFCGMLQGNQSIQLAPGCRKMHAVVHEIGHAIGLYHEHMRNDRDTYVTIHTQNILHYKSLHHNIDKMCKNDYDDYGKPYDYLSIMHYSKYAFSKNPRKNLTTIVPTDEAYLDVIGEVTRASFHDFQIVNHMYKCSADCKRKDCPDGAFHGKDCMCYCNVNGHIDICNRPEPCSAPQLDQSVYQVHLEEFRDVSNLDRKFPNGTRLYIEFKDRACGDQSNYTICNEGQWLGEPPECLEEKRCLIPNSWLDTHNVTAVLVDLNDTDNGIDEYVPSRNQVRFTLKVNPELSSILTCQSGNWSAKPVTEGRKDCPQILNATVIGSFLGGFDVTCISGYTLSTADVSQFTCSHVGEWEPTRPYCNPKGCVVSLNESHASVTYRDNVQLSSGTPIDHADSVNVTCPHGMFPDLVTATCQLGYWDTETGQLPQCKQEGCVVSLNGSRASVTYRDNVQLSSGARIDHADSVNVTCPHGMFPNLVTATCQLGYWDTETGQLPQCKQEGCVVSLNGSRASVTYRDNVQLSSGARIDHADSVNVACPHGMFPDLVTATCQLGYWDTETGQLPQCKQGTPIDHADSVNVTCPHGMFPDLVTATCQLGYWDTETGQLPQCKQVDCPRLSFLRRLSYKPNLRKYVYKDKISMSKCRGNLEFYGEKELTCTQHGNWSGIAGCRKYCRNGNDAFIDVKGHTLRAKIIKVLQLDRFSAKLCKEKCTRERRFLCMSVTYGYSNKKRRYICNLYKTDPTKAPRLKGPKQFWTLSYRSCSPVIHVDKQT